MFWPLFVLQLIIQKIRMCQQLWACESFVSVLEYLLAVGNYLNQNAGKDRAKGFRLSSLTKVGPALLANDLWGTARRARANKASYWHAGFISLSLSTSFHFSSSCFIWSALVKALRVSNNIGRDFFDIIQLFQFSAVSVFGHTVLHTNELEKKHIC